MKEINLFEENRNINLIIKTAGNTCNIDCTYCFEQAKDIKKEFITPEKLEKIIGKVQTTCSIVFHGGEPLIVGHEKFAALLDVVRKYYPNKVITVKIQTNGTLLDEEWMELLYEQYNDLNIEIAISLDGTKKMNCHRVDYAGIETFDKIRAAYDLLYKHNKLAGMLSVISKQALDEVGNYIELISSIPNLKFVKINALFNVENDTLTKDSITPMEYAEFVYSVACRYIETGLYKKLAIEPILSILQQINGRRTRYCNYSKRKCFNYLSIYPDGKVGPCDCFSVNEFMIFDIDKSDNMLNNEVSNYVKSENSLDLKNLINICSDCNIKDFCAGGCIAQRYYFRNNQKLLEDFCKSKHYLYEHFCQFCLDKAKTIDI